MANSTLPPDFCDQVLKLRNEGLTWRHIAERLQVTQGKLDRVVATNLQIFETPRLKVRVQR